MIKFITCTPDHREPTAKWITTHGKRKPAEESSSEGEANRKGTELNKANSGGGGRVGEEGRLLGLAASLINARPLKNLNLI